MNSLVIGIDATNIRQGGGLTHLFELLNAADPSRDGFSKCIVWTGRDSAQRLPNFDWLEKVSPPATNGRFLRRTLWQAFELSRHAREANCNILLVPGGSFAGNFRPVVSMSQNLLPFEWSELSRYGFSSMKLKMILLRYTQSKTFRHSDGVIFLTHYASKAVSQVAGSIRNFRVIPHGINPRFFTEPNETRSIDDFSDTRPFKIIYVSTVDVYKHQWTAVEAIDSLRKRKGWPISIDFIGHAYPPSRRRLESAIRKHDPDGIWAKYLGPVPFKELHCHYANSHLAYFGSSCENMPCILLEMMAAGLPVCSSSRGPMPEIINGNAILFDPESPSSIEESLETAIGSAEVRANLSKRSKTLAAQFCWETSAAETFGYLREVARRSPHNA
jgi:glycosyltransferase involved in cell wall biosynthesis